MGEGVGENEPRENEPGGTPSTVVVRYWAAARAASGVASDLVEVGSGATLADVLDSVRSRHSDRPRLREVIAVCSVLVGDRPVGATDPGEVVVHPGDTVELLPPFAGGAEPFQGMTTDRSGLYKRE